MVNAIDMVVDACPNAKFTGEVALGVVMKTGVHVKRVGRQRIG